MGTFDISANVATFIYLREKNYLLVVWSFFLFEALRGNRLAELWSCIIDMSPFPLTYTRLKLFLTSIFIDLSRAYSETAVDY